MDLSLLKKLLFRETYIPLIINMPESVANKFEGVTYSTKAPSKSGFVLLFVKNKEEFEQYYPTVRFEMIHDAYFWIAYPKGASKLKTDLSRDVLWQLMATYDFGGVSLISIDDTWSAMRFRPSVLRREKE